MRRCWLLTLIGGLIVCEGVSAADSHCPATSAPALSTAEILDGYFSGSYTSNSRRVETYRVASGLGATGLTPDYVHHDYYSKPWTDALQEIAPAIAAATSSPGYAYPCRYQYAADVLRARVAELGKDHPYVHQWIETKNVVIQRCMHTRNYPRQAGAPLELPPEMPTDDARVKLLQQQDREYERAADAYYEDDPAALAAFDHIADSLSVHRGAAMYMSALMRVQDRRNPAATAQGLVIAERILADPTLAETHRIAKQLLGYVSFNSDTPEYKKRLLLAVLHGLQIPTSDLLSNTSAQSDYRRSISDIDWFGVESSPDWWLDPEATPPGAAAQALSEVAQDHDLVRWLLASKAVEHFLERPNWIFSVDAEDQGLARLRAWLAANTAGDSPPIWLILRASGDLMPINAVWGAVHDAVAATQQCATAPQGATLARLFFHVARRTLVAGDLKRFTAELTKYPYLYSGHGQHTVNAAIAYLLVSGRQREARHVRDLLVPIAYPPSTAREYSSERYALATLRTALAENRRRAVEALSDPFFWAVSLLNLLPVRTMQLLAADPGVRPELRAALSRAAWAREYALRSQVSPKLDAMMLEQSPAIHSLWMHTTDDPQHAGHRRLLNVLRTPRIGILVRPWDQVDAAPGHDPKSPETIEIRAHSDNNWWCALQPDRFQRETRQLFAAHLDLDWKYRGRDVPSLRDDSYLDTALEGNWFYSRIKKAELRALSEIDSAPRALTERVLEWGDQTSGADVGLDEALHRAVVTTRYGCQRQGGHGVYSRRAYRMLYKRFPGSFWTNKTPYWFDCEHFSLGCRQRSAERS